MPVLPYRSELDLQTRCENQVENEIDRRPTRPGDDLLSEDYKRDYPDADHRPTAPTRKYNCHGLTFASRRTWIWKASEIAKVLADDEYKPIDVHNVLPGDIVVYDQNGDAEHSGVVIKRGFPPIVLSKWGPAHEVVHRANYCPYDSMRILYYRITT